MAKAESPSRHIHRAETCPILDSSVLSCHVEDFQDIGKMTWPLLCWRAGLVLVYFGIGIAIGSCNDWSITFSLYFTVEVLTTVGYGDFSFKDASAGMHLFVSIFVLMGVFVMGAALSAIFMKVFESERSSIDLAMSQASQTLSLSSNAYTHYTFTAAKRRLRMSFMISLGAAVLVLVLGAVIVGLIEGWSWHTSFYWSCVTFTSVGFGDVVPNFRASQMVATVLMLVGVLIVGSCAGVLGSFISVQRELRLRHRIITQFGTALRQEDLRILSHGDEIRRLGLSSSDDCITRSEFCLFMLAKLGRITEEELRLSQAAFDTLDVTHTGVLNKYDLRPQSEASFHRASSF